MEITGSSVRKLSIPERYVSDSQVAELVHHPGGSDRKITEMEYAYLELHTNTGDSGVGFAVVNMESPGMLAPDILEQRMSAIVEELVGKSPFSLVNALRRHRGGQIAYYGGESYGTGLRRAVDFALWDLCGKHLEMPLYQLLGGSDPRVPAYASGLAYPASESERRDLYATFSEIGLEAAKVKVGSPTVEEDIDRLSLVVEAMDNDPTLLIDANEAWTPKETVQRARTFRDAGFDIYWIEDPVLRYDVEGMRKIADSLPFTNLTIGDYLGFEEKQRVIENDACDILNLHGISPAIGDAHLAISKGVAMGVGTDHAIDIAPLQVGAALPDVRYMEFTNHALYGILDEPYEFEDGYAIAPDRPGHGIEFPEHVLSEYSAST